ncbi:MAG TPA: SO2930 family diheme c-type cytochrome [Chitinophagales bacterium]|nr:SO2930 family diheme c-type cytochrome [Chitinophagales bacterium]
MKSVLRLLIIGCFPITGVMYLVSCNVKTAKVALDISAAPFDKLSDYHFFTGTMSDLKPNARVVPYDLNTPLFTDYAHKARFIYIPDGKTAQYDTNTVVQFPVGSCLIKNFYYPDDFRVKGGKKKIIETRLLVHRADGWEAMVYVWNDDQTEAMLDNTGEIKTISWTNYDGSHKTDEYVIPNKNQCKGCHWSNTAAITPIGPKVRNLNRDLNYGDITENELAHLTKLGMLTGAPSPSEAPKLADWSDSVHYSLNERARAYLDVNCGHCHNPKGPAYTSGLYLNYDNKSIPNLGFCKPPVAAGKGTGARLYDIVPGHPDESILTYRISSVEPGIRMPELGRSMVHAEGVELLTQWIASMPPSECKAQNE